MSEIQAKSYRYLRTAMVGLLVSLGAAVFYQSLTQQSFLSSVSAYYYTPAQAIFVGALIGLGACMIALRGMDEVEEVFLNIGGMLAAVVAIVPTSRGEDYRTALRACRQADAPLLTDKASGNLDCPTLQALAAATKVNVENNLVALLVVGVLALLAAGYFALRDKAARRWDKATFLWGLSASVGALAVLLIALISLWTGSDWVVDYAHYIAAIGLLVCIFVVAVANARRRQEAPTAFRQAGGQARALVTAVSSPRRHRYTLFAAAMLVLTLAGTALFLTGIISLFVLEILVALLFAVFWMVQTVELEQAGDDLGQESRPVLATQQRDEDAVAAT